MDKKIALENLVAIRDVLNELGIRYFLIDGTLLGLIRDNDFIRFDLDTDIGVLFEDFIGSKIGELGIRLEREGFSYTEYGDYNNNFEASFVRNGVKTDLFFYRKFEDKWIFHAFLNDEIITYFYPREMLDIITETKFKDEIFAIPKNAEEILAFKYGADWRIEDRGWDWAYSPKNILNPHPIVFTVGCFDCLHEGHIDLFDRMAKAAGHKAGQYNNPHFWVLIHDDYSIFQNKKRLPVQTLSHRSMNLDILKITHSIEVNHADPTPELRDFIKRFPGRQLIFMRGDDWSDFPGRKYLEDSGVEIIFKKYTEGVSSSSIRENL